jgi:hypothetical protein
MPIDLSDELRKQLKFLSNSCGLFDGGDRAEAVRMAVVLRILFHDTSKSTSLLKLLGASDVKVLSTIAPFDLAKTAFFDGVGTFFMGPEGSGVSALPHDKELYQFSAPTWWHQIVIVNGASKHSRKSISLDVAHKLGGAHVDDELPAKLEELVTGIWTFGDALGAKAAVADYHGIALRRFAYEVLNSAALAALANSYGPPKS